MRNLLLPYTNFCKRICSITEYIERMMIKNESLHSLEIIATREEEKNHIKYLKELANSTIQYNAVIISIYGCFENFIDDLLDSYVRTVMANTKTYDDLPVRLRDKYRNKLGEYLCSPQRYSGLDLDQNKVLEDYLNVLNSDFETNINPKLITRHSSNLKVSEVVKLMTDVGFDNPKAKILNDESFRKQYLEMYDVDEVEYKTKVSRTIKDVGGDIFYSLDRIVEQRNNVAHGWSEDNRINIIDIVNIDIPFMLLFSKTLLRLCLIELFKRTSMEKYSFNTLKPIKTFSNHILCMNNQGNRFCVGDFLLYKSGDTYKCSEILNLQIDRENVSIVDKDQSVNIGIELIETVKDNDDICIIVNNAIA